MGADQPSDPLATLGDAHVQRTSMAEQIVAVLRDEVLRGALGPGTSLPEVALAEKFGVSRNTIREALRLLTHEGLARHQAHRGAIVAEQTAEDLADIYRARATLELAAVDRLPEASGEQLERIAATVSAMRRAVAADDGDAVVDADLAFHRSLVALLGSTRLDQFYAGIQRELRLGLATLDRRTPDPGKVAEHQRLADLALARDVISLRAAVFAHLTTTEADLRHVFHGRAERSS